MRNKLLDLLINTARCAGLAALAGLLAIAPASANDSSASLDVDGLHLNYNPNVKVESEDLYLSLEEVRVAYRFHNTSDRDVSTLVAFPLPVMYVGEAGNYVLPDNRDPINFMDFQVTADGKRVEPSVEVKAIRHGVDVTEVLKRHGIPLTMLAESDEATIALHERLDDLPDEAKRELERYGVIDWNTSWDANDKPLASEHWETHITFYWFQTFPAGRTIEVTHRYHPVPRHFFFVEEDLESEMRTQYCFDQTFAKAARAMFRRAAEQRPDVSPYLQGRELKYVLATAGNWLGLIGKFRLEVKTSSPDVLVSLCAEGIKRTSPTTLERAEDEYGPNEDLNVLFIEPFEDTAVSNRMFSRTILGQDLLPRRPAEQPKASPDE